MKLFTAVHAHGVNNTIGDEESGDVQLLVMPSTNLKAAESKLREYKEEHKRLAEDSY